MSAPEQLFKVLLVDDEPGVLSALRRTLLEEFMVLTAPSGPDALDLLGRNDDVACILTDQRMPGMTGAEFLARSRDVAPQAQRVVLTGYTDLEDVIRMINEGQIHYYLTKPWEVPDLKLTIRRACETWGLARENRRLLEELRQAHARLQQENLTLKTEVAGRFSFENVIGTSVPMRDTLDLLRKVLATDTTVLLLGETGAGKEVLARALHYAGPRAAKPFVGQNCAALPESLLVSELFGHVKGSFTGAIRDKKGLFEQADGGTIFLDEIGETTPEFQQKLLRTLQEGEIWPVGSERPVHVDVRVAAATNRDLQEEVKTGRFREDLYYRLSVFPITVPPLRERVADVPLLVDYFVGRFSARMGRSNVSVTPDALEALMGYAWPGNVRELENEIERALVLVESGSQITPEILSSKVRNAGNGTAASESPADASDPEGAKRLLARKALEQGVAIKDAVEDLERALLDAAISQCGPNKARIARTLGLSRMGLDKKLARYGIEVERRGGNG